MSAPPSPSTGRLLDNVASLGAARLAQLGFTLAATGVVARALGPEAYGVYGFGIALASYFALATRFGFETYGAREVAREPHRALQFTGEVLRVRLGLAVAATAAYLLVVLVLPAPAASKAVWGAIGGSILGVGLGVEWTFKGLERMRPVAFRRAGIGAALLVGAALFVRDPSDALAAGWVWTASVVVTALALLAYLKRDLGTPRLAATPWSRWLGPALPFVGAELFIAVYYNLDVVLLGALRTSAEVGFYEVAHQWTLFAVAPAGVLYSVFLPRLAATPDRRAEGVAFARWMLPLGFSVAVSGALTAELLVALLAGAGYAASVPLLQVLMLNVGLVYLNMAIGQPLLVWDRQRAYLAVVGAGALVNTGLNLAIIPAYGALGAAWTTVAAEVGVLAALLVVRRGFGGCGLGGVGVRALGVGAVVGLAVWGALKGAAWAGAPGLVGAVPAAALAFGAAGWAVGLLRKGPPPTARP